MTRSARLLAILNMIRNNRSYNAARLAKECNVTERTIYRDITTLIEIGAPIYYDKGYKLVAGSFLPPLNLNSEEYVALKVAISGAPFFRIANDGMMARGLLTKLDLAVNSRIDPILKRQQPRQQVVLRETAKTRRITPLCDQLNRAIEASYRVDIDYLSLSGKRSTRLIDPYFLIFRGRAFYLVGFCHLRGETRIFRLDRISKLRTTTDIFERDHKITLEAFFANSWEFEGGEPVEVRIQFSGKAAIIVLSGQHHPSEKVKKQGDGSVIYSAAVAGIGEIARWIIAFGDEAKVLAPKELADLVRDTATAIARTYSDS